MFFFLKLNQYHYDRGITFHHYDWDIIFRLLNFQFNSYILLKLLLRRLMFSLHQPTPLLISWNWVEKGWMREDFLNVKINFCGGIQWKQDGQLLGNLQIKQTKSIYGNGDNMAWDTIGFKALILALTNCTRVRNKKENDMLTRLRCW
jgi:hypothetical protein